jgi:ribonuclease T2
VTGRAVAAVLTFLAALAAALPASAEERGGAPGRFDFYVLALSWSPNYCESDRRRSQQCESGRRLGFVVHGLWPQHERGFPTECGAERGLPRAALDAAGGVFPDEGLARHQWRRHGTCSGLGPGEYMQAVRDARAKIRIPEPLSELAQDGETSPQAVERAFVGSNPGLRADMMSVQCRRGALQEVRICLTRDLRAFRPCPEVDRRSCRVGPIRVTAPR